MFGKKKYEETNSLLNKYFTNKQALIAVHRGAWGGNIVENTIPSCKLALDMGGDMFECDVISSADGVLYAFHDGQENRSLNITEDIRTLNSEEIDNAIYMNSIGQRSGMHVERFENILAYFNNGELFNIDRAWDILPKINDLCKNYPHVLKQAIIKTPVKKAYLDCLDKMDIKYMYMPIVYNMDEINQVLSYENINLVGIELIARNQEAEVFKQECIDYIHSKGLFVWVNVLKLGVSEKITLYAGLDDDLALLEHPDKSWGILFDRGVDILQTDWPYQLNRYRNQYFKLDIIK